MSYFGYGLFFLSYVSFLLSSPTYFFLISLLDIPLLTRHFFLFFSRSVLFAFLSSFTLYLFSYSAMFLFGFCSLSSFGSKTDVAKVDPRKLVSGHVLRETHRRVRHFCRAFEGSHRIPDYFSARSNVPGPQGAVTLEQMLKDKASGAAPQKKGDLILVGSKTKEREGGKK